MIRIDIKKEAALIEEEVISWRRFFHSHPEAAFQEYSTREKIVQLLGEMNIDFFLVGETGVIGEIARGHSKTIGLRADMDALMMTEKTNVSYKSQNPGVMHACGHDAHMAALLGAAKILKKYEPYLEQTVRLIFQPAEENCSGAKMMVKHHVLEGVEEIYGIHVFTDIPAGRISIESGPRMASTDIFKINITGKAGHAAKPQQCVDATLGAAATVMNLQSIVSREMDPVEGAVVTVGRMVSGTQYNIISGQAQLDGTVRSFSKLTSAHIGKSIERIATSTAQAYGAEAKVTIEPARHPVVFNDPVLTEKAVKASKTLFEPDTLIHVPPMMLGEDFSVYQSYIPGLFAFVGAGNSEIGCDYPNHHDCFNIDEAALADSVALYTMFAMM